MPLVPLLALLQATRSRRLLRHPAPRHRQRGQATTEYALVLLGAAAIALLLVGWATRTGAFASLLDAVLESIKKKV
jgi:hypothetical protein